MITKTQIGQVLSTKMDKTIAINVITKYSHPIYKKIVCKHKKYLVHDEHQVASIGDRVLVQQCRPISKRKHWNLIEILM